MATTLLGRLRFLGPLVVALLLTTVGVRTYLQYQPPPSSQTTGKPPTIVYIKPKTGVQEIAQLLRQAGVIRTPWAFLVMAYLQGSLTRLQAGEYEFTPSMSLLEILHRLESGRILTHQVTIPEGFTARIHNALQGNVETITKEMWQYHFEVNRKNAERCQLDADAILIHDPQPSPLIEFRKKGQWIWRCHIDVSNPVKEVWKVLSR